MRRKITGYWTPPGQPGSQLPSPQFIHFYRAGENWREHQEIWERSEVEIRENTHKTVQCQDEWSQRLATGKFDTNLLLLTLGAE